MSYSGLAMVSIGCGIVAVLLFLGVFVSRERFGRAPGPDRGVGFVQARLACEETLALLSPKLLEIEARERRVEAHLRGADWPDEGRRKPHVEAALREAGLPVLWGRFGAATSLVEGDPERALGLLEDLRPQVDETLELLAGAEDACGREPWRSSSHP